MLKQICFFRKRPDMMTMEQFMDYHENQHSQLSKRMGRALPMPNAVRYVRRYRVPDFASAAYAAEAWVASFAKGMLDEPQS
jgi:hypothetical protein